jgi:uncharacterized membrane protein YeaQ/YmgE (transglycosylase-associated protein family)
MPLWNVAPLLPFGEMARCEDDPARRGDGTLRGWRLRSNIPVEGSIRTSAAQVIFLESGFQVTAMQDFSPTTQAWVNIVLMWVGFGSLAGLLARVILPFREPSGSLPTLTLGITGSAVGLGLLSWIQGGGPSNPISPIGFLAAVAGAFGLLLVYHLLRVVVHREPPRGYPAEGQPAGAGNLAPADDGAEPPAFK